MARAPRSSVSKTAGQGVSRLSYQKGRKLAGGTPALKGPAKTEMGGAGRPRSYAKTDSLATDTDLTAGFGDTLPISDLQDVEELGSGKRPKASVSTKPAKAKVWK